MTELYLGIGSNLGNRADFLDRATVLIEQKIGIVSARSRYYESLPRGFVSEHNFLNAVLKISTGLTPGEVLILLQEIEVQLERIHKGGAYQDRTIDLDILLFGDLIISESGLMIPHPRMQERRFVLLPLAEIAGSVRHPVTGKSIERMLAECQDVSRVEEYKESI